jgi:hypothetical protein
MCLSRNAKLGPDGVGRGRSPLVVGRACGDVALTCSGLISGFGPAGRPALLTPPQTQSATSATYDKTTRRVEPDGSLMLDLLVIIMTKNSGGYMAGLVAALEGYPRVMVVDSGSVDETVQIARGAQWEVAFREYRSSSDQLNWALSSIQAEWVLILDSDELPLFTQAQLIRTIERANRSAKDAVAVRRRNYAFGVWARHGGWYPDWQVRVLRCSANPRYESDLAHAHVMVRRQRVLMSELELRHVAYATVDSYWRKLSTYTSNEAATHYGFNSRSYRLRWGRLKVLSRRLPGRVWVHFAYRYFFRLGILDGRVGWHLALWSSVYQDVVVAKRRFGGAQSPQERLESTDDRQHVDDHE